MSVSSTPLGMPLELTDQHRQRYLAWYEMHRRQIGEFSAADLLEALHTSYDEAVQSGIDTPSRFFLYATARLLMPDMQAAHYIVTMDIVFGDSSETEKIENILIICNKTEQIIASEYQK